MRDLGFAFTPVDADWWFRWMTDNSDSDLIRSGAIVGPRKRREKDVARAEAREHEKAKTRSGLEPIDPSTRREGENRNGTPRFVSNDPRVKGIGFRPEVGTVEKAAEN
jgi:hypothetical protein